MPLQTKSPQRVVMTRMSKIADTRDRSFDLEFWQAQSPAARFAAAWELVEGYLRRQGRAQELELQRYVTALKRRER